MPNCHKLLVKHIQLPGLKNRLLGRSKIAFYLDGKLMLETEVRKENWESEVEIHDHQDSPQDFFGGLGRLIKADPFTERMLNEAVENLMMSKPPLFRSEMVRPPIDNQLSTEKKEIVKPPEKIEPKQVIVIRKGDCVRCGTKKAVLKDMPCLVFNRKFQSHLIKK